MGKGAWRLRLQAKPLVTLGRRTIVDMRADRCPPEHVYYPIGPHEAWLKTRRQSPNGVDYAKPHITKLRPNLKTVLALQKWDLKPVNQESLDQHQLGHLPLRRLSPPAGK